MKAREREKLGLSIILVVGLVAAIAVLAMLGPIQLPDNAVAGNAVKPPVRNQLTVTPNPCLLEGEYCKTKVQWATDPEAGTYSAVYASLNGRTPVKFTCEKAGKTYQEIAPWISMDTITFTLHATDNCSIPGEALATVVVTATRR